MSQWLIDFHFLRPAWLFAIVPLLLLVYFTLRAKRKQGQWHQVLPKHLASLLIDEGDGAKRHQSGLVATLCAILATLALAGPTWERIEQPLFKVRQAQVIIADMSLSMYSTDLAPNRLTRAKFKIKDLISRLSEGETGLVAYAGDAFVISPMTQDVANLNNLLPALNPQIMPVYGSNPSIAIERALELLTQTQYSQGQIYLITDGLEPGDAREITQL
ncbi:MAG: VWA domain-containing protein, partial [Psychrobium sp.]